MSDQLICLKQIIPLWNKAKPHESNLDLILSPEPQHSLADLHTKFSGARLLLQDPILLFYIHFHQKVTASELNAPPNGSTSPPAGNPGSAPSTELIP